MTDRLLKKLKSIAESDYMASDLAKLLLEKAGECMLPRSPYAGEFLLEYVEDYQRLLTVVLAELDAGEYKLD